MKSIILVACVLVAAAVAAPPNEAKIVRSEYEQKPEGPFNYAYETDQGIAAQVEGSLKEVLDADNKPQTVLVLRGTYSYVNDEGKVETITYLADENGYNAQGDSIPKVPARR